MKVLNLLFLGIVFSLSSAFTTTVPPTTSSTESKIPSLQLKTLDGQSVDIYDYIKEGQLTVISFWATWCTPCKAELDALTDFYPDWRDDYNVELLAVTIDNARGLSKVPAEVTTKGWEFTVLSDVNSESMNVLEFQTIPQTFVVDGEGHVVYAHNGYTAGDEYELDEKLAELAAK